MSLLKILRVSHVCSFVLLAMLSSHSNAQVIENDAVLLSTPGGDFGDLELGLSQSPSLSDFGPGLFGFGISDLGNDEYRFGFFGIAELYALFPGVPGDAIGPSFVESNTALADNFSVLAGTLTLPAGESVYLGYWDDRSIFVSNPVGADNTADADDNFGWLELGRSDRADGTFGQLEILGGATAIGQGIIVGTTTAFAIPEPSSVFLVSLLSTCAVARRRRR